ncbi:MAG: hypothetical protein V9E94_20390 [Microthrixaceae bacterium]
MTVRSASHPSGPSLVVGVSSVHGVSAGSSRVDVGGGEYAVRRRQRFSAQAGLLGWAQAPSRSAIAAARVGFLGQVGHPGGQLCGAGLPGEVEQERGEVAQVGQVCRGLGGLSEDGHLLSGEGGVDAGLQRRGHPRWRVSSGWW